MPVAVLSCSHAANIIYRKYRWCIVFLMMLLSHVLVGVCWIFFGLVHSFLASLKIKNIFRIRLGKHYKHYRLAYNVFAILSFAAIVLFQFSIHSKNIFTPRLATKITGAVFIFLGLVLMLVCIKKYFAGLSGLRSLMQEDNHSELIISGVHRYVRHPLYLGTFIFIWGLFILFPTYSLLLSNVIITGYTLIGINMEERKLVKDFGEQYELYQKQVPRLIPKF